MTHEPCFAWDTQGFLINQTCYFIPNANLYMLGFLNSKLVHFYIKQIASNLGEGAFRWIKQYIEQIPIPKINAKNKALANELISLVEKRLSLTDTHLISSLDNEIDELVFRLYDLNEAELKCLNDTFML